MAIKVEDVPHMCLGRRLSISKGGTEVARAFVYVLQNNLHDQPFALLEDVYVEEAHRGDMLGTHIIKAAIKIAQKLNCYKLVATSRHERERVHRLYRELGFIDHGIEFRINF
jgi:GNAT superfamily N-acetyltransferase